MTNKEIVTAYLTAMFGGSSDFDGARKLLADDLDYEGPMLQAANADELVDQLRALSTRFGPMKARIRHLVAEGDRVAALYEFSGPFPTLFAEWFSDRSRSHRRDHDRPRHQALRSRVVNAWLVAAGMLAMLLAIGHVAGGTRFVYRPMVQASFDEVAKRTMVFVWHFSTLVLFMAAGALLYGGSRSAPILVGYVLVQTAALAVVHLLVAATSGVDGWYKKMPQWVAFAVIAGLTAAGL